MSKSIEELTLKALFAARRRFLELGEDGKEQIQKENRFDETTLRADWESEEAVINVFRQEKIPITIVSEEHGKVQISKTQKYTAVLDGIDGTRAYTRNNGGYYGTMVGVFKGVNPSYGDYLCSGVMEHSTGSLFFAEKGKKAHLDNREKEFFLLRCNQTTRLDERIKIFIDSYWEFNRKTFSERLVGFNVPEFKLSSTDSYLRLLLGEADLVLECTRKGNLEIATAYGLITEAGGVMVTADGEDLGKQRYFEYGQREEEFLPVITAATKELALGLIEYLKK